MEELLQNQKTEIDEFLRMLSNYRKNGSDRKTEKYLNDKVKTFGEVFQVISRNDEEIQNIRESSHESQPYFVQKTYEKTVEDYEKTMADVDARLQKIMEAKGQKQPVQPRTVDPPSTSNAKKTHSTETNQSTGEDQNSTHEDEQPPAHSASNGSINNSITTVTSPVSDETNLLTILYNELMDCMAAVKYFDHNQSNGFIRASLNNLTVIWTEFRSVYLQEKSSGRKIEFSYPTLLQKYIKVTGELNELCRVEKEQVKSTDTQFSLPKLKLHEFNGKFAEWKSFIANFDRMIHNNEKIDDGMKIEYLKMSIKGDAAKLINHIDPNPENYQICYDILKKRFENKREILNNLIANIINLP